MGISVSAVVTRDLFLSNADSLITILVGLLATRVSVMIAWAHCSCCVASSPCHGSHSLQRVWMAFSISSLTSIWQLVCVAP